MFWILGIGVILLSCTIIDGLILERQYLRSLPRLYQTFLSFTISYFCFKSALAAGKRWGLASPSFSFGFWHSKDARKFNELMRKYRATMKEKAILKLECDRLRAAHALAKADNEAANQMHLSLVQKHVQARFLAKNLASQNETLSEKLGSIHNTSKKRTFLLRTSLNLLGLFWHYVQMAIRRNRFLADSNISLQSRISALLTSNLALRKSYLEMEERLAETRKTVNELVLRLTLEESARDALRHTVQDMTSQYDALLGEKEALANGMTALQDALVEASKDSQFFQALAKSIVVRYDRLQTEHGNLLVKYDLIKSDIFAFCDDLGKVASQVQDAQDLAEIGLNDLQRNVKPLKTKQDLMKIGQALALVRLMIAELMRDMTSSDTRDSVAHAGECSNLLESAPCTPGSIEDAVRKIKKLYEAGESTDELNGSFVSSDTSSFRDDTFDDSGTVASSSGSFDSSNRLRPMMEGIQRILCEIERRESSTEELTTMLGGIEASPRFRKIVDASRCLDTADDLAEFLTRTPTEDTSFGSVAESDESKDIGTESLKQRPSAMHNASQRFPKMINLLK